MIAIKTPDIDNGTQHAIPHLLGRPDVHLVARHVVVPHGVEVRRVDGGITCNSSGCRRGCSVRNG